MLLGENIAASMVTIILTPIVRGSFCHRLHIRDILPSLVMVQPPSSNVIVYPLGIVHPRAMVHHNSHGTYMCHGASPCNGPPSCHVAPRGAWDAWTFFWNILWGMSQYPPCHRIQWPHFHRCDLIFENPQIRQLPIQRGGNSEGWQFRWMDGWGLFSIRPPHTPLGQTGHAPLGNFVLFFTIGKNRKNIAWPSPLCEH